MLPSRKLPGCAGAPGAVKLSSKSRASRRLHIPPGAAILQLSGDEASWIARGVTKEEFLQKCAVVVIRRCRVKHHVWL